MAGRGPAVEKMAMATSEDMAETKTNYMADRRATSSIEHGNNEGSTAVMAITATPRCMHKQRGVLPERQNASLADLLSGKYTICSISPDVFDRTDVIPVVALFEGAGGGVREGFAR